MTPIEVALAQVENAERRGAGLKCGGCGADLSDAAEKIREALS